VRLVGIELSPEMLKLARERAVELSRQVDLYEGDAERLPYPDAAFDSVVITLALCSIPDDAAAVREAHRVLRPGGRLLLLEHVASPKRWVWGGQWLLDHLTVRLEGDHLIREPVVHLRSAGFEIEELERLKLGIVERVAARKPA
jgi:ubiquinone/menaquinone biosynthesis C-methylase UbiE